MFTTPQTPPAFTKIDTQNIETQIFSELHNLNVTMLLDSPQVISQTNPQNVSSDVVFLKTTNHDENIIVDETNEEDDIIELSP